MDTFKHVTKQRCLQVLILLVSVDRDSFYFEEEPSLFPVCAALFNFISVRWLAS